MPAGLEINGPSGAQEFSTARSTTRVIGVIVITSMAYPPDPTDATGARYRDFPAPSGSRPWAHGYGAGGVICSVEIGRANANTGRLVYAIGPGPSGSWPANGRVTIFYGYC